MLGASVDLELGELLAAESVLRQHALNRVLDDALRMLLDSLGEGFALLSTGVAG